MVEQIKEYKQKNGVSILKVFLNPTDNFPDGKNYFYTSSEAIDLVQRYSWVLRQAGNKVEVTAHASDDYGIKTVLFKKELFKSYLGYNLQEEIDSINLVDIDNIDSNLKVLTNFQVNYNRFIKGYNYDKGLETFQPCIWVNPKYNCQFYVVDKEDEACILQNRLEQVTLKEKLGTEYYMFDFLKYRRGSEDILDLERTGKISEEEATYKHILRYSENAWYYLRYNLEQYFKDNNIPVPKYSLDIYGFMTHPITGRKLCPF